MKKKILLPFIILFSCFLKAEKKINNNPVEKLSLVHLKTKITGYYPDNSKMEGGFVDRYDHRLNTLQDFLSGKASYVSIAIDKDKKMNKYRKKIFCIPELEKNYRSEMNKDVLKKYNGHILFKVVDTGNAFNHKKLTAIDVCVAGKKESLDSRLNIKAAIYDCNHLGIMK